MIVCVLVVIQVATTLLEGQTQMMPHALTSSSSPRAQWTLDCIQQVVL